jgi:hypothetical protein
MALDAPCHRRFTRSRCRTWTPVHRPNSTPCQLNSRDLTGVNKKVADRGRGRNRLVLGTGLVALAGLTTVIWQAIRADMIWGRFSSGNELGHRSIGVLLLLAVFFLPLHYHAATAVTSQISKECSCLYGSRTQINLASATAPCTSLLSLWTIALFSGNPFEGQSIRARSSRAPPSLVSL